MALLSSLIVLLFVVLSLPAPAQSQHDDLLLAQSFLNDHHYAEAMQHFEAVLAADPHSAPARTGELAAATAAALASKAAGDQQAALATLRQARRFVPDDPILLRNLGVQALTLRRLPEAAEALHAALALAPHDPQSIYTLARVEEAQADLPAAERDLRAYLAARPGDATAHYGLGHILQMQLRNPEAAAEFTRSIDLQPLQTESYYQLGQMALDDHRDAEAGPLFERTLVRDPAHGGALTGLGILAFRARDYTRAAARLRDATAAVPDYQPAHYYLGLTLARLNEPEASARELEVARQLAARQQGKSAPVGPASLP